MAISRLDMERQLRNMGGIMSLEEPRQGYFLGKLVKKAKKAVKKVVKSPFGKAALLAAPFLMGGGAGSIGSFFGKGSFNPFMAKGKFSGLGSLLNKAGLVSGTGGFTGLGKIAGIGAASGLAALLAGQEEEDETDYYRGEGLDIPDIVRRARMNDPEFRFLPGADYTSSYANGGVAGLLSGRPRYQTGGDVAYDASDKDIYGSSAMTITPDTVIDQFGNQVQSELGNDFNKPLIPQVTEEVVNKPPMIGDKNTVDSKFIGLPNSNVFKDIPAAGGVGQDSAREAYAKAQQDAKKQRADGMMGRVVLPGEMSFEDFSSQYNSKLSGLQTLPVAGGIGGLGEIDMPIAGGNNNAGGILPVMPINQLPGFSDDTNSKLDVPQGGMNFTEKSPNMSDEDIMKGFAEYQKQNPYSGPSTQAVVNLTLPGGTPMSFRSGAGAAALRQYLQSIGMKAGPGQGMGEPLQPGGKKLELGRVGAAEGGIMNLGGNEMDLRGGGFVPLGAKEKADDVPARLSKNEFVMTADAVRAAGGGSVDKGADKMYNMMKNLEAQV